MEKFDLGLSYIWEYDDDFVNLVEARLHENGLSFFRINEDNIRLVKKLIANKQIHLNYLLDRAWDEDVSFEVIGRTLRKRKTIILNSYEKVLHAIDKATMHLEFLTNGILVPYSIIIPPHNQNDEILLSIDDLAILGRPFIIKPCNTTGGGIGVVTGAETLHDVLEERMKNSDDKYLLQEKIYPAMLDGKRAWFRSFWAFGNVIPLWWDDETHIYNLLSEEEINYFKLKPLYTITKKIAKITELDFFSTEIVFTPKNKFVVIDYVNDQCDMRFQSKHYDGVPDIVIEQIVSHLIERIKSPLKGKE